MSGKKRKTNELPTREEQQFLRETDMLMKANLTQLKLTEMQNAVLSEPPSRGTKMDKWLESISSLLKGIKARKGVGNSWVAKQKLDGLAPLQEFLPQAGAQTALKLDFEAPDDVLPCGSYAMGTQTKPFITVDMLVTIPASCLEKRDIRGHVYFDKRRLYLAVLAQALKKSDLIDAEHGVRLTYLRGDVRKPILVVLSPTKKRRPLRIIPCLSAETFKLSQLADSKNNVRPQEWLSLDSKSSIEASAVLAATPDYNHAILEDAAMLSQRELLLEMSRTVACFRPTVALLKVWLRQRGFCGGGMNDTLDAHSSSLVLLHLLETRAKGGDMTPLSAFQLVMKFLAEPELRQRIAVFAHVEPAPGEELPDVRAANLAYPVHDVGSGKRIFMNLLWRLSTSAVAELQLCANQTLRVLQTRPDSTYEDVFCRRTSFLDRYALVYSLKLLSDTADVGNGPGADDATERREVFRGEPFATAVARRVTNVATRALGDRAQCVRVGVHHVMPTSSSSSSSPTLFSSSPDETIGWPVDAPPNSAIETLVVLGVVLDSEKASRTVERGPSPDEEKEAAEFVSFWGEERAGLRRFRDGSIIHAVAWGSAGRFDGAAVIDTVLRYILSRHLPSRDTGLSPMGHGLRCGSLNLMQAVGVSSVKDQPEEAFTSGERGGGTLQAVRALDALKTILTSQLDGLALNIDTVSAACPGLRYTSLAARHAHPLLGSPESLTGERVSLVGRPLLVLGKLEMSGKWPADPRVAAKLKTSLLLQASTLLKGKHNVDSAVHEDSLDVFYRGFLFRLRLVTTAEQDAWAYMKLEDINESVRDDALLPLHHSNVHSLCARHPSYPDAVRLFRLWLARSLFSGHVPVEMAELMVASVYMRPLAEHAPSTPEIGFCAVLQLLVRHAWAEAPLIVDFTDDMSAAQYAQVHTAFTDARDVPDGGPSMFVVASYDRLTAFQPHLTRKAPESVVLRLLCAAAKNTHFMLHRRTEELLRFDANTAKSSSSSSALLGDIAQQVSELRDHLSAVLVFNKALTYVGRKFPTPLTAAQLGPSFAHTKLFANSSAKDRWAGRLICAPPEASSATIAGVDESGLCPVQASAVATLRADYGYYALFFWDETVGNRLGVLLRPARFLPEKFTVLAARHKSLCPEPSPTQMSGERGMRKNTDAAAARLCVTSTSELLAEMMAAMGGCTDDVIFL